MNCYKDLGTTMFDERYNVQLAAGDTLQRLVDASCTGGTSWECVSARRIENSQLWKAFVEFKLALRSQCARTPCTHVEDLPGSPDAVVTTAHLRQERVDQAISIGSLEGMVNEHFLWHATSKEAAAEIAQINFQIDSAASGLKYGPGAYFAEELGKALAYSMGETKCVLLCRVACGDIYYTETSDRDASLKASQGGKTLVLANPQRLGPREFVALRQEQIYPEFILELQPAGGS